MSHWKASGGRGRVSSKTVGISSPCSSNTKCATNQKEKDFGCVENEEDDIHSASLNTYLLFPEELPKSSKEPLFPQSRKNFLMMSCKRTLVGCRGLFVFCFIVFIVISLVSSHNGNTNSNSDAPSLTSPLENSNGSNGSENTTVFVSQHPHGSYETILLPSPLRTNVNSSETIVNFNVNCSYKNSDYALIGNALRKGLEFYEGNVENVTVLDAALGAKIVAEQLKQIQKAHKSLPVSLKTFLHDLETKASILTEQIANTVKRVTNRTEDLQLTLPWIETEGLWNLPAKSWYPVGSLKSYNPPAEESFEELWNIAAQKEVINEAESDACIYQVFHCDSASITEQCRNVFLNVERSMYSLTHQVIYMLLAQKNECSVKSSWKHVPTLAAGGYPFLEKLCGKVWQEANSIVEANFPPKFRDLFIEQVGMCSLAGYSDFLRRDWLRRMISWQSMTTSGCFGDRRRRVPPSVGMLLKEYQRLQSQIEDIGFSNHKHKHNGPKRRIKRSDVILESGQDQEKCSVHYTSVGITALSLHLRYFFDTCLDTY